GEILQGVVIVGHVLREIEGVEEGLNSLRSLSRHNIGHGTEQNLGHVLTLHSRDLREVGDAVFEVSNSSHGRESLDSGIKLILANGDLAPADKVLQHPLI